MHPLTRLCFLLLVLGRLFLLCPPFPAHAPALISPLSRQGAALAHLDSLLLMIWYSELTALFLFLLARAALAFLATALSVALMPLFPFRQAQFVPSFFAEACAILHALCWSRQHQQVCHFSSLLLSDSRSLKLCGRSGRNCFLSPSVLSGYNGSPDPRFSRGTTRLMSWPDEERCLRPLQPLVVSLLLSIVSTLAFSRTGGVLSHRSSLTHRFPRFPPRNLCSLVMLTVSSLVFAATDTTFCCALVSLGLQNRESFLQCLRTPLISFRTVQLWTLCTAHALATLCASLRPLIQALESFPAFGDPWFSAKPPSLGRGWVINNNNMRKVCQK